jgi:TaqI-like C-terminal specificity domain
VLVKQIIDWTDKRIWAAMTEAELYNTQNAFVLLPRPGWTCEFLLGLLNSKLLTFYHRKRYLEEFKMRFQKILIRDCKRFPIPSAAREGQAHSRLATEIGRLALEMTSLSVAQTACRTQDDVARGLRQMAAVDA